MAAENKLFITLVGGGNSTLCMAPLIARAGHTCAILTRRPADFSPEVEVVNEDLEWCSDASIKCTPDFITSDYAEVVPKSDIVWLCGMPVHHNEEVLKKLKPHLRRGKTVYVGTICAYGGFDWLAKSIFDGEEDLKVSLFGTQLIPWCCGTLEYGKKGLIIGAKRILRIPTEGGNDADGVKTLLQPILKQNLVDCDFLTSTLWPNNTSLHCPILYGLFKDWDGKTAFKKEDLPVAIYKDATEASCKYICQFDDELCSIVDALRKVYPNNVGLQNNFHMRECVMENYESQVGDGSTTASCIKTNKAFAKHKIPYEEVEGGIVPIIHHKFFESDVRLGLVPFCDMARMLGVETPLMDAILLWNQKLIGKEFVVDGKFTGKDMAEAICPSRMGYDAKTLTKDGDVPAAKRAKTEEGSAAN